MIRTVYVDLVRILSFVESASGRVKCKEIHIHHQGDDVRKDCSLQKEPVLALDQVMGYCIEEPL